MIGILGGMGALATIDILQKIYRLTPATSDQDYLPVLVHADPTVPDRTRAILQADAPSPLPALLNGIGNLERGGASFIAIACNTAHHWHAPLQQASSVPILDMIEVACTSVAAGHQRGKTVGILATAGTVTSGLYQRQLERLGFPYLLCQGSRDDQDLNAVITATKAKHPATAVPALRGLIDRLVQRRAQIVLLGCTELPIVWSLMPVEDRPKTVDVIDVNETLAAACVDWGVRPEPTFTP